MGRIPNWVERGTLLDGPSPAPTFVSKADAGFIEMSYTGDSEEVKEYPAPTGRIYKFSTREEHRMAWVHPMDVNYLRLLGVAG